MVEQKLVGLTEDETELYDRQIRLWGYEAQWKLRNARILVIGMDGLGAEVVKNIVLSGVKSVVMWDDKLTSEDDFENQFLIPQSSLNINRAEASKARAQVLNPLVLISCDNEDLSKKPDEYYKNFELVLSVNQDPSLNLKLDEICRKHNTLFNATGVYGTFGYIFYDLNEHRFTKHTFEAELEGNVSHVFMATLLYPSLKEVTKSEIKTQEMVKSLRKTPSSIFLYRVITKFQEDFKRRPTDSEEDYLALLKLRFSILEGLTLPKDFFPTEVLRALSGMPSPICAIVGAVVAQELVKSVTQTGTPHRNFFFFDPLNLVGHIMYIGPKLDS